jgi:hypothetical protein
MPRSWPLYGEVHNKGSSGFAVAEPDRFFSLKALFALYSLYSSPDGANPDRERRLPSSHASSRKTCECFHKEILISTGLRLFRHTEKNTHCKPGRTRVTSASSYSGPKGLLIPICEINEDSGLLRTCESTYVLIIDETDQGKNKMREILEFMKFKRI